LTRTQRAAIRCQRNCRRAPRLHCMARSRRQGRVSLLPLHFHL
jgi:hypothetical protein